MIVLVSGMKNLQFVNSNEPDLGIAIAGTNDLDKTTLSVGNNCKVKVQTQAYSNHMNVGKLLNISGPQFCHL